ncbi:MAG: hypothetical protein AB8B53_14720 [Flavobacteriales bacterium]
MEVLTQYPSWFIIFCIAGGLIFASSLYLKDKLTSDLHPIIKGLVALFRFLAVAILAFFLLEPLIKNAFIETEKPIVVIAQDNSESLAIKGDTAFYKTTYPQELAQLEATLSEDFEVNTLTFGSEIKNGLNTDYSEKQTDLSALIEELYSKYSNRNLGAVIVSSDGIYTKGKNPLYSQTKLKTPIYTVALGDTTRFKDVLIQEVAHNRLAYLGNKFPIEITSVANSFEGSNATLKVTKNGRSLFTKTLSINSEEFSDVTPVILSADKPGIQKFSISISQLTDEVTYANNRKDIYIDVLDSRQKVAIIAAYPHPDISTLRKTLQSNENYEVDVFLANEFNAKIADYNLAIFHQMPSNISAYNSVIQEAFSKKVPSLFVWGNKTNFSAFNDLNLGVSLENYSASSNSAGGMLNGGFKSFTSSDELKSTLRKLPPLSIPFGKIEASPGLNTLLYQQVGPITTDDPLLTFNEKDGIKIGVLTGEGLWRWRLVSHLEKGSHDLFDSWLLKTVQFLANKTDKSLFRISTKNAFDETQRIVFNAEVYNESYEPLADKEITISITNQDGDDYPFTFSQNGANYRLDAGILPAGNYAYTASVNSGGKTRTKSGQFSVSPVVVEQLKTQADHNLLYNLADRNGGQMIYPEEISNLADIIKGNAEIVPVSYEKKTLSDLINYKWLLAVILAFLCLEWLIRKRSGVY